MIWTFLDKDQRDWDVYLHEFRVAYNLAVNSSTEVSTAFSKFSRKQLPNVSFRVEEESPLEIHEPDRKRRDVKYQMSGMI